MNTGSPNSHGVDDESGDVLPLPDLPIPRPGEARILAQSEPVPGAPGGIERRLGGGASLTAVGEDDHLHAAAPHPTDHLATKEAARQFDWTIAARLTAGMLANPAMANATPKDALALFEKVLAEARMFAAHTTGSFSGDGDAAVEDATRAVLAGTPEPIRIPSTPQPMPGHSSAATPYVPGNMAGAPPTFDQPAPHPLGHPDEHAA